eukprot:TRINITY_DN4245_c0_g2_i1.p1 TRINITY_DN4245_c0_g2~~TRINITY_DN4245_c0_g2_i1.p1  ORF type:complete len:112 (+),score=18.06 TRINITY_DN4245_c0_g2_i1:436-771(+)
MAAASCCSFNSSSSAFLASLAPVDPESTCSFTTSSSCAGGDCDRDPKANPPVLALPLLAAAPSTHPPQPSWHRLPRSILSPLVPSPPLPPVQVVTVTETQRQTPLFLLCRC